MKKMAKKRTKADRLQHNVERLSRRDEAWRAISDQRSGPNRTIPDPAELEEQIRLRAYELYQARGREHGHELEDCAGIQSGFPEASG